MTELVQSTLGKRRRLGAWGRPALALAIAVLILVAASAAGLGATLIFERLEARGDIFPSQPEAVQTAKLAAFLFAFQFVVIVATVVASERMSPAGDSYIRYGMPLGGFKTLIIAPVVLMLLAASFGAFVYLFDPKAFVQDMSPFAGLAQSSAWWLLLLAAGVGAPLAEETLFRGFLYGALRTSPIGKFGAALVTAVTWSALHANYSLYGMTAIVLIGLYFALLRERTKTLSTAIVCHGLYNSLIVAILAFSPPSQLIQG